MQGTLSLTSYLISQTDDFLIINKEKDMYAQQGAKVFGKALTAVALVTLGTVETLALSLLTVVTSPLYLSSYTRPLFQAFKDRLVMTLTSLINTANGLYTSQKIEPAKADPKKEPPAPFNYKKAALLAVGALAIAGSVYLVVKHQEVIQKWAASIKNPFFNEPPPPPSLMEQVTQKATDTALTLKDYSVKAANTLGEAAGPILSNITTIAAEQLSNIANRVSSLPSGILTVVSTAGTALSNGAGYVWDHVSIKTTVSTIFQAIYNFEVAFAKTILRWEFAFLKATPSFLLSLTENLVYYVGYSTISIINGIGNGIITTISGIFAVLGVVSDEAVYLYQGGLLWLIPNLALLAGKIAACAIGGTIYAVFKVVAFPFEYLRYLSSVSEIGMPDPTHGQGVGAGFLEEFYYYNK